MINVTDIRITKIEGDEKLRAFAAIVIDDCFLVGDLRVVEGEDGFFVAMPSKRKRDGSFKDIAYPLNNDVRLAIEEKVLLAYEAATGTGLPQIHGMGEGTVTTTPHCVPLVNKETPWVWNAWMEVHCTVIRRSWLTEAPARLVTTSV